MTRYTSRPPARGRTYKLGGHCLRPSTPSLVPDRCSLASISCVAYALQLGRLCSSAGSSVPICCVACAQQPRRLCPSTGSPAPISWASCAHQLHRLCPTAASPVTTTQLLATLLSPTLISSSSACVQNSMQLHPVSHDGASLQRAQMPPYCR